MVVAWRWHGPFFGAWSERWPFPVLRNYKVFLDILLSFCLLSSKFQVYSSLTQFANTRYHLLSLKPKMCYIHFKCGKKCQRYNSVIFTRLSCLEIWNSRFKFLWSSLNTITASFYNTGQVCLKNTIFTNNKPVKQSISPAVFGGHFSGHFYS